MDDHMKTSSRKKRGKEGLLNTRRAEMPSVATERFWKKRWRIREGR